MNTYKQIFIERQKRILNRWKQQEIISSQDLYEMLDNMKNTACYVELEDLSQMATYLIGQLIKINQTFWTKKEWGELLEPLVNLIHEQEQKLANRKRILLIDNDVSSLSQTKEALENQNYEVLLATNTKRAVQLFYDFHPNILILDLSNDQEMTFQAIHRLKKRARESGIIIIVIGNKQDTDLKMKAYDEDVTDYIEKPIQYNLLESLMQNRIRQQQFFRNSVLIDELTQAYNRTFLSNIWKELIKKYKKWDKMFCVAILDLDYFKQINDQYGHGVGDEVLRHFSSFILDNKRKEDYFIRYGGEEFILIINELDQSDTANYLQQLLEKLKETPYQLDEVHIPLNFTAGVSEMNIHIDHVETLIEQADHALYYGKENGRKQIVKYNALLNQNRKNEQEEILKIAIVDDDRFIQRLLEDKMEELEMQPYTIEVKSFSDGESFIASDWYKGRDKKILLLDGILPNLDGFDVLEQIREIVNERELGIIMLTGRQKNSDMVKALEKGADDYITKPFSLDQLEARMKRLVQRLFNK
ncbi:Response regulator PleD [Paraliobacillus sp. PM-2]|uniref:diguanylate cyclase n=1 Tax=Paraliobacillus sp. PM-2 TaxID=1462524 RepID=UPI00061BA25F|nr:diguanylate cyclase [Paraliobacillus sp. PM-2]CQR47003.1 Response regulator PleD [Paraliobacillus sp. PM-2]